MSNGSRWRWRRLPPPPRMPNPRRIFRRRRSSFSCRSRPAGRPTWSRAFWRAAVGALGRQAGGDREPARRRHHRRDRRRRQGAAGRATLLVATNSLLINPAINQSLPYDTPKDFAPVSMIATQPVALVATKSFAGNHRRRRGGGRRRKQPTNYTSPGPRGVGDLAGADAEAARRHRRRNFTHINYNGSAPALTDVIAGRVPLMFDIWHSAQALCRGRRAEADRRRQRRAAAGRARCRRPSRKAIPASR